MHAIRFEQVTKRYRLGQARMSVPAIARAAIRRLAGRHTDPHWRNFDALHDVSFEVASGDSVALVGANGAGKTTALKLMARITEPSAGRVAVQGRLSALIELGAGFHGDLTGRENVFLNGAILGLSRADVRRRFDEIVGFSELEAFIDTPVKRYSSGMIVRLGFAVASSVQPEVLLVDEVLAVGDAAFSQKSLARIADLRAAGTTLVFVSHNPYLVRAACRSGIYLRGGRLQLAGTADEVVDAYDRDVVGQQAAQTKDTTAQAGGSGPIALTGMDLVINGRVNPTEPVSSRADAEVRIRYEASAAVGHVQAVVMVRRADGLICCAARSRASGSAFPIDAGRGTICLHLARLQLTGGAYSVEAYLTDRSDVIVLTPGGVRTVWFTVVGQGLASTNDAGVFEPAHRWSHESASVRPVAAANA